MRRGPPASSGRTSVASRWRDGHNEQNTHPERTEAPPSATPLDAARLMRELDTTPKGLTSEEARRRLARDGPNTPGRHKAATAWQQALAYVSSPMFVILIIASALAIGLGETINGAIIATMAILSVIINAVQSTRSEHAAMALRSAVAPMASALRDGEWREVHRDTIVRGDIVRLAAGDMTPADALLLDAHDLHMQEAALTGESFPVEKSAEPEGDPRRPLTERRDIVLLGTSVVSGAATALVCATGDATALGDVIQRLSTRAPETEFDRGIRRFSYLIMRTVVFLVLFALVVTLARQHDPFEALLFAVALAVGLTPEFLPIITTVTLGQGAQRMARRRVIVKHLATIQNFGSMDILCSDKTGTITAGDMRLQRSVDWQGEDQPRPLELGYLNSALQTGVRSPLDAAILARPPDDAPPLASYTKIDEAPFDFERRRLSVVVEREGRRLLITKGAPESVLPQCDSYLTDGAPAPLNKEARARSQSVTRDLSARGFRLLAVAYREPPDQPAYTAKDETQLILAGYLAFIDPPKEDADETIAALERDGVEIKILTGDNELVTAYICEQVGIKPGRIVMGAEIDKLDPQALGALAERTTVFARVTPGQKNRILLALKARGHVVGFLGDGVNDAPSLHMADVGISVSEAVDVAKDAAEIILLERSLEVLHAGVLEGRKAFGNVMKYLLMATSSNFGNMFSMAGATLFLPFLPMTPTQIILNNFMYDLSQVTIPSDAVDESYILKPRHWDLTLIRNFMLIIGPISSLYDFLTFFIMLSVFHASESLFHTGWFVESLATQTLVIFVIRTMGNPLKSRPSAPLAITITLIVLTAMALPFTPLAPALGFTPLPLGYFLFLIAAVVTYLCMVEIVKRRLMRERPVSGAPSTARIA
ncbi:MAG TPA: magnesium-translocating P-type ATPase [Ktedonobacterales bacterium]|nr:magnesium-translocating P-type ATPase [Ktedonobacterales bacterium]